MYSVECKVWSINNGVWSVECRGSSVCVKYGVWSVKGKGWSVKRREVSSVECKVWSVE